MNIEVCLSLLTEIDNLRDEFSRKLTSTQIQRLSVVWSKLVDESVKIETEFQKMIIAYAYAHRCSKKQAQAIYKNHNEEIFLRRVKMKIRGIEKVLNVYGYPQSRSI